MTCVPVGDLGSEVAVVAFLQLLNTRSRAVEGSHLDLQQRLIDPLMQALCSDAQTAGQDMVRKLAS